MDENIYRVIGNNEIININTGSILTFDEFKAEASSNIKILEDNIRNIGKFHGVVNKYDTHLLGWNKSKGFMKVFYKFRREVGDNMGIYERAFMNYFIDNLEWETNRVVVDGGKDITNKDIANNLKVGINTINKTLNTLEEIRLIRRVGNRSGRKIFVNPNYAIKGKDIRKDVVELFQDI